MKASRWSNESEYVDLKSSETKIGDEFWCYLTKRWLKIADIHQQLGVRIGNYPVRRKVKEVANKLSCKSALIGHFLTAA